MRFGTVTWVLLVAGSVASAQSVAPGQRVRVLGATMARRVVTQVAPVYPAIALAKGITGEVTLYAGVGKDGLVEEVAVVDGPVALQTAAVEAVKHWKFKPWLVDGEPVSVDTTVVLEFRPGTTGAPAVGVAPAASVPTARISPVKTPAPPVAAPAGESVASLRPAKTGGVDWEVDRVDRRTGASPVARGSGFMAGAGGGFSAPSSSYGAAALPGRTAGADYEMASPRGLVGGNHGPTEWRLAKKVAPVYPQEAEDAGIEGVVQVAGVVTTEGRLRDLHVVSGPAELQQAAVDAAAQYVYVPMTSGDELAEASTRVPVVFSLTGPAKVAPEVMAGMVLNSFAPPYPAEAVKAGVQGAVKLHVLIGRQGEVKDVKVISGREMLRATAVDAVKQWQYKPYRRNGVDVEVETDVMVQFSIVDR